MSTENNAPAQTETNHLTRKQLETIPHLIGARNLEEGRLKAKVSKSVLFKWLKDPVFTCELERARTVVINDALERLKAALSGAVEGLIDLTESDKDSIKYQACSKIVEHFLRIKELEELGDRVAALEKTVQEQNKTHGGRTQ